MSEVTKSEASHVVPESKGLSSDTKAMMAFEAAKKSVGLAYVLWFFFGSMGVHRFYMGRTGSGIAMLVIFVLSVILAFVAVGLLGFIALWVWLLVDAFLIPGIAREYNQALVQRIDSGLGA